RLELAHGLERFLPAVRLHHADLSLEVRAKIALDRVQHLRFVVDGEEDRLLHEVLEGLTPDKRPHRPRELRWATSRSRTCTSTSGPGAAGSTWGPPRSSSPGSSRRSKRRATGSPRTTRSSCRRRRWPTPAIRTRAT